MGSAGNAVKKAVSDTTDYFSDPNHAMNAATFGMVGLDGGKITAGSQPHAVDEAFGEITGRNMQRKQLNFEQDQVNTAQAQQNLLIKNRNLQNAQMDQNASSAAAGAQRTAASMGGQTYGNSTPMVWGNQYMGGDAHKDFLGL